MFKKAKRFIRNIKLWYPILTTDKQWDYHYIYVVLEHKLKLTEDFFRGDKTHSVDVLMYADEIKDVREALNRLIEDDYMSVDASKFYREMSLKDINTPRSEDQSKQLRIWWAEEEKAMNSDKATVFNSMRDKINGWWD